MIELVGDSDGEVKVISSFWVSVVYLPLNKALEYVSNGVFHPIDSCTVFVTQQMKGFKEYIKEETLKRDDYKCVYCHDHADKIFRPVHKLLGGKLLSIANSVTCCATCINRESNKQIADNIELRDKEMLNKIKKEMEIERESLMKFCKKINKKLKKGKSGKKLVVPETIKITSSAKKPVTPSKSKIKGTMFTDASFKDGKATLATVIYSNNEVIHKSYQTIETNGNIKAELEAILTGLKIADIMNIDIREIYTDCQSSAIAIGKHDEPRLKMAHRPLIMSIRNIVKPNEIKIQWIPREQNEEADTISRKILVAI